MKEYTVYWYKRKDHSNPYTEGYIGITNNMQRRDKEHHRNKQTSHFTNALKAYKDIDYVVLQENITLQEASDIEQAYRPGTNIGWNSAIGGIDTLSTLTTPITMYHESDPETLHYFTSITKAAEVLDISVGRISQAKSRKSRHYGYDGWAILLDGTIDRALTKNISTVASEKNLGLVRSKPSPFKGMTDRWTDEDKERISKQHKGKIISEKQKQLVSEKHKASHPACKVITLVHKDNPDQKHTYHSISEASRQLNIPLSTLKSKAQRPLGNYGKDGWKITNLGSE